MTESTQDTSTDTKQEFLAFLATTNKGRTATELTEHMQELVEAIRETGKSGSLTYTLTIKPVSTADQDGTVTVKDEISIKKPKFDRPSSTFFVDEVGNLVRNHPNQRQLFD